MVDLEKKNSQTLHTTTWDQIMIEAGLWDVEGKGLTPIENPDLASAILDKVNRMNFDTGVQVFLPVAIFAALPQSSAAPLVAFALLFTTLYAAKDRIPTNP